MSLNFSHPQKSGWAMAHMAHMPTRALLSFLNFRYVYVSKQNLDSKFVFVNSYVLTIFIALLLKK